MAKFTGQDCYLGALVTTAAKEGLGQDKNIRTKLIEKSEDIRKEERRIGSIKSYANEDKTEVKSEDYKSEVVMGSMIEKEELISDALFNLYIDTTSIQDESTAINENLCVQIAKDVTLSEIKSLTSNFGSAGTTFYESCASKADSFLAGTKQTEMTMASMSVNIGTLIETIEKGDIVNTGFIFGSLDHGAGSTNCSSFASSVATLKTDVLLATDSSGNYKNKPMNLSNAEWLTLVNNAVIPTC
jgi:hypothetical protein